MNIQITRQPTIFISEDELSHLRSEYDRTYMFYAGTPPTFESFVRRKQLAKPFEDLVRKVCE